MPGKPRKRPTIIQPQDPSYRLIALTRGQVCKVDISDYDWLMQWSWYADWNAGARSFGAARMEPIAGSKKRRTVMMHAQILDLSPGFMADHINHDELDNRRGNLRAATIRQNNCNQRVRADNNSGRKGVTWHKAANKWAAQISIEGKRRHLGVFDNLEDAAEAYKVAALAEYGEFACVEAM
jgi:hypothetical protein